MSTTKTAAPVNHLATSALLWVASRPSHAQHEAAVAEVRRRHALPKCKAFAKLDAFLVKLDGTEEPAVEAPEIVANVPVDQESVEAALHVVRAFLASGDGKAAAQVANALLEAAKS